jgi:hypothetical protein
MHAPAIVDIPYWFDAKFLRVRCRNPEDALLRGAAPYAMPHLTKAEVEPALTVSISFHPRYRERPPFRLTWLSDGKDWLRPVQVLPGPLGEGHREYAGVGEPMTLDMFRDLLALRPGFDFDRYEFPERWLFDRNPKLRSIRINGRTHDRIEPPDVETTERVAAVVKEWMTTGRDEAEAEAIRESVRYVLVEGILHRRVPLPVWIWTGAGNLAHGEKLPGNDPYMMWPMGLTDDFGQFMARIPTESRHIAQAEAEIHAAIDHDADLARIGSILLDRLWPNVVRAAPHLSDANIDRYKAIRAARPAARTDLAACIAAMAALEVTLSDPGWIASKKYSSDDPLRAVARPLAHWRRLLHAGGHSIMDARDEEALAALA